MPKVILLPKFDLPCALKISKDTVACGMLPHRPAVRVAICQDGRLEKSGKLTEAGTFQKLYDYVGLNAEVKCYEFSFFDCDPAAMLYKLESTDIIYFTGFSCGQKCHPLLTDVFKQQVYYAIEEDAIVPPVQRLIRSTLLV